ncbi:unnamed protein product [Eretmochelys imbricata]
MAPGSGTCLERSGQPPGGWLALAALALLWGSSVQGGGKPGCPACRMPTLEPGTERRFLLELAKRQVLEKLHLMERPNVTQPVPRLAVTNALRRLHVGQAQRDRQPGPFAPWDGPEANELGYEIISFAKTGGCRRRGPEAGGGAGGQGQGWGVSREQAATGSGTEPAARPHQRELRRLQVGKPGVWRAEKGGEWGGRGPGGRPRLLSGQRAGGGAEPPLPQL